MFRTTLLTTSCALMIGSAAFAQTSATTTPSTTTEQPAEPAVSTQNMFGNPPSAAGAETNIVGFFEPKAGQLLVSSFIGQSIYESDANDAASVGKLNDLITSSEGQIVAAVVGVGGFLGVGEKDVAVSPDQLQLSSRSDGKRWLIIKVNKDELNAAPAFDRAMFFADGVADPAAAARKKAINDTDMPPAPTLPAESTTKPDATQSAPTTAP